MSGDDRRTILVIDDTPEDIAILREELKAEYRVLAAIDHETVSRAVHAAPLPDLILLDIMMPDIDGYELCRELKADPDTSLIPVIFVTARDAAESEAEGFAAGCVDYITKPVNPLLVRARVRTHVELKAAREDLLRQNEILRDNMRLREEVEAINRHDIKNPLMIIMNVPQVVLSDPGLSEGNRRLLKLVDDAGHRILEMVNSTIDMLKMEKGTYVVTPVAVEVCPLIERIAATLRSIMNDNGVAFEVKLDGGPVDGRSFSVWGEDLLVYSLLANLLKNAVESSPTGATVTVALETGAEAVISIHNDGAIPEPIRGRFFQKFATAGRRGGTGLGAYSARLMTTTLGGWIGVETSEERGTTVTVKLPPGTRGPG
jgi:two-component system, sensor histidine kinase and response regulator